MNRFLIFSFLFLFSFVGKSESFFEDLFTSVDYGKPLVSEMHSTFSKLEIGYERSYDEYNMDDSSDAFDRPMVIVDIGLDLPIYSTEFADKKFKFGLSLPVSMHILEDMFETQTAPLLDTDYRFGSPKLSFRYKMSESNFIKNLSLIWIPMSHECTHLGDEIIIHRTQVNLPILRVNISYEFTEFALTLNDPEDSRENLNTFRLGTRIRLTDDGYGWFSIKEGFETDETELNIKDSTHRFEYYFDYQFQRSSGFLASKRAINVISLEARANVRLGYPIFKKDDLYTDENPVWDIKSIDEKYIYSFNLYLGWFFYADLLSTERVGIFLRAYKGLNPFGQMRNYANYRFVGLSITYNP